MRRVGVHRKHFSIPLCHGLEIKLAFSNSSQQVGLGQNIMIFALSNTNDTRSAMTTVAGHNKPHLAMVIQTLIPMNEFLYVCT